MKINTISIYQNKQNINTSKPSFKAVEHFDYIKKLPNMICACCGEKVLPIDTFVKAQVPLSRSLTYNLQRGTLDYVKKNYPSAWKILNNFTEQFPEFALDEIMETKENYVLLKQAVIQDVQNKSRTRDIKENTIGETKEKIATDRYIGRIFFNILANARSNLVQSSRVIQELNPLKPYLTKLQQETLEQFEVYANKYPDKTLSEIANIDDIHAFHKAKDLLNKADLCAKRNNHFNNIRAEIEKSKPEALDYFDKLKTTAINLCASEVDPKIRLYKTIELYKSALAEHNLSHLEEYVTAELSKVPMVYTSVDTFFVYAKEHRLTDGQIISQIFNSRLASEEHIESAANGGSDRVENKLVMHKHCNDIRRVSYDKFANYHPEMSENVQRQVDLVMDALLNDELPDFLKFYPLKMPQTLKNASKGLIKINVKKYCIEALKQSEKRTEDFEQELRALWESITLEDGVVVLEKMKKIQKELRVENSLQHRIRVILENDGIV